MLSIKYALPVLLIAAFSIGCGGAKLPAPFPSGALSGESLDPIEIPRPIPSEEKTLYERDLDHLPKNHPSRRALRDELVKLVARQFSETGETKENERLELFEEALGFHHPSDFKPGAVSTDVRPMAEWVAQVFGERGDESVVLAALRFLMLDNPGNAEVKERYLELYEWSESIRMDIQNPVDRLTSLINLYLGMVELVPDREMVERLAGLYVERHKTVMLIFSNESGLGSAMGPMEVVMQSRIIQNIPIELIYIFALAGDPAGARVHLEELVSDGGRIIDYMELLDRIFHGRDKADSYYTLANHLRQIDPSVALGAAIRARAADSDDSRFPLFIGELYDEMDLSECAFDFFVEAAQIAPSQDVYIKVLELYGRSLIKVFSKDLRTATERAIDVADAMVNQVLKLYPDKDSDVRIAVASFLYTVGEIEFDSGNIDGSIRHLKRSFEVVENLRSLIKLSEVYYMLGQFTDGLQVLNRARDLIPEDEEPSGYWHAILLENRGNLTAMLGQREQSLAHYRDALAAWDIAQFPAEQAPVIAIRRGILLDRIGDLNGSKEAFIQAVRLAPNRESTYAQLISFLVIRGRLEDAKYFYRLAHNQDQIDDTWKIYYSLWVEGLSLRATQNSFSLASGYLKHSNGDSWQDNLAKFFSGEISEADLAKRVTRYAEEVEMEYYVAVKELAAGKIDLAKKRLHKVLASKLLGFFEYKMAFAMVQNKPDVETP